MPDAEPFEHRLQLPLVPARWRVPAASGLQRQRLLSAPKDPWEHGLVLLVAPAGSGKTTLLAQFAAGAAGPVAWFRAESSERDPAHLLRYLEASLEGERSPAGGRLQLGGGGCRRPRRVPGRKAVLVLDDLHTLEESNAEEALGRPLPLSSSQPGGRGRLPVLSEVNLSRLRLDGRLRLIEAEDLRFRAWEVERLYSDLYRDPLVPEDLAR